MRVVVRAGIWFVVAAFLGATSEMGSEARARVQSSGGLVLAVGTVVERDIDGGAAQTFVVDAAAGEFVHVRVEQRNTDVELRLAGPTGSELARRNRPESKGDPEGLSFVASVTGRFVLTVTSLERPRRAGTYTVTLTERGSPGNRERAQIEAERLTEEGNRLYASKSLEPARQRYEAALPLWQQSGAREWEALTELRVASACLAADDVAGAVPPLERALAVFEAIGDRRQQAAALTLMTEGQLMRGDARRALEFGARALALAEESRSLAEEQAALSALSSAHWMLGNLDDERRFSERSLAAVRLLDDRLSLAVALQNDSVAHLTSGRYHEALSGSREALALYRELGETLQQSAALNTIGEVYRESGQLREALGYHLEALAVRRKSNAKDLIAQSLTNTSLAYRSLRDFDQARTNLDEALALRREAGNRRGEANALLGLGAMLYADLQDYKGGLEYLQRALAIDEEIGNVSGEAAVLVHLGRVLEHQGDDAAARLRFTRARDLARRVGAGSNEIDSLRALAGLDVRAGDARAARAHLDEALRVLDGFLDGVLGDELRSGYVATNARVFEQYVDLLMQQHREHPDAGHDLQALGMAEQGRARGLLRLLAEAKVDLRSDVAPELMAQLKQLQRRVDALAAKDAPRATADNASAGTDSRELNAAITELQELRARIRASSPRFSALVNPQPLTAREIQAQALEPGTVLLEYALGPERSYLWALTSERVHSVTLPPRKEIESLARRAHGLLQARNDAPANESLTGRRQRLARAESELAAVTTALSTLVLGPVADQLRNARRVVVSADGELAFVPFALLPQPGTKTPLVASHEVVGIPSVSAVTMMRRARVGRLPPSKMLAVFADPMFDSGDTRIARAPTQTRPSATAAGDVVGDRGLESDWVRAAGAGAGARLSRLQYTGREADAILSLVRPDQRISAMGAAASRSALESEAISDVRLLHLATHGFVNGEYPELSGIALSMVDERGQPVDGFFRLNHIYNLKLNADLVVLSACQTALGAQVRGEGLVGLSRGLMYAGAARVVASLWKVDDQATAELMRVFYEAHLGPAKLAPAAALRHAQNWMRRQPRWADPYFWAAWILHGDPS